jgi:hypothetical protein
MRSATTALVLQTHNAASGINPNRSQNATFYDRLPRSLRGTPEALQALLGSIDYKYLDQIAK